MAAGIVLVGVVTVPAAPYRVEDLRPVVALLDARVLPDDVVLVDPVADWATTLYTESPISVVPDDRTATPFRPRIDRPRTVIPDWYRGNEPPGYYDRVVEDAVLGATTVWLVLLEHGGADDLVTALEDRGFLSEVVARAPGARLERWARSPGGG